MALREDRYVIPAKLSDFRLTGCRDAVVQEDFMKAVRKVGEMKKHETAMYVHFRLRLRCSSDARRDYQAM